MTKNLSRRLAGVALAVAASGAVAQETFPITRFQVEGNTSLPAAQVQQLVAPLAGPARSYDDVQKALEALEAAYAQAGFSAVRVTVPEQELTGGVVRIKVTETVVSRVTLQGNQHFGDDNIRASLPALRAGQPPNLREMSQAIQLANDNPAKQVAVTLAAGEKDGTVDARVEVTDSKPLRVLLSLDNTGTKDSGRWRTGVALQHANLFDRDHVGTLAYTTSPDRPGGVRVDLYSVGYRVPLYALGDSLDFVYGQSDVNAPGASPTLGGLLGFTGKGRIWGLHWNHFLPRRGETSSKLVAGIDRRETDSRCNIGGMPVDIAPPTPPIASCVPYTTTPLSVTYSSQTQGVGSASDSFVALSRNVATGTRYTNLDGRTDRYSYLTPGNRSTRDGFMVLRGGASWLGNVAGAWQLRVAGNAQYASNPLVASERLGLTGASAVRGFNERAVVADSGAIVNTEFYTPPLAGRLNWPGNLQLLVFYDLGHGRNGQAGNGVPARTTVSSAGLGARYAMGRDASLRLDVARVGNAGGSPTESRGDWRAHLAATLGF